MIDRGTSTRTVACFLYTFCCAGSGGAVWYNESGANPNTMVRFDPKTEKFQAWVLPSGPGSVRNMMPAPDGNLWIANSAADKPRTNWERWRSRNKRSGYFRTL